MGGVDEKLSYETMLLYRMCSQYQVSALGTRETLFRTQTLIQKYFDRQEKIYALLMIK